MISNKTSSNNIISGISYFLDGIRLIWHPKLRLYILVPLVVNCVLFFLLTTLLLHYLNSLDEWTQRLNGWLAPLKWIALLVIGILLMLVYGYSFNMITNIIAAPFYGLLAEKAEEILSGNQIPDEAIVSMVVRVMLREIRKLLYFIGRGVLVFLIIILVSTIPGINFLAPVIGLAWGAWTMAIQYVDYSADNNQYGFEDLRKRLWVKKFSNLGFGGTVMACSMIPVINIFAMPAAVVGGTIYWLAELKNCYGDESCFNKNTANSEAE